MIHCVDPLSTNQGAEWGHEAEEDRLNKLVEGTLFLVVRLPVFGRIQPRSIKVRGIE